MISHGLMCGTCLVCTSRNKPVSLDNFRYQAKDTTSDCCYRPCSSDAATIVGWPSVEYCYIPSCH